MFDHYHNTLKSQYDTVALAGKASRPVLACTKYVSTSSTQEDIQI